jgi:dTDP-4-amino-4,6-dideoxygalactose transaminase
MVGGIPILTDINSGDGNMDISNVSEKSDGIIPVHIYGNPCDFESIKAKSEEEKIPIIEDACQAHGAEYNNKKVGSLGDVGCFSFYPTKNMTVGGDGGMVTTNNEDVAKTIISLRDNGRQTQSEHDKLGYTMRLNTINAAIGRVQLKQLDHMNSKRREIAQIYKKNIGEENFLIENSNGVSVYHQIVLKHENRDKIIEYLKKNEIGYAVHYSIPINKQPLYLSYGFNLQKSEKFSSQILSLPSYPSLTHENIKIICEKINDVI